MTDELTPGMQKVMERIQKLLNLAGNNPNEAEAAAAAAKAQDLLTEYNLDAAVVARAGGAVDGRREDLKTQGGFYMYQRKLWESVAELHFCLYWTQRYSIKREKPVALRGSGNVSYYQQRKQHRLVGRLVNTRSAVAMAQYLEGVIERLTRERINGDMRQLYGNYAMSFREGMADKLCRRLHERFQERLQEEQKRKDAEAAARAAGAPATGRDLVLLSDYVQAEEDANKDFLHGEGYSARQRARAAEYAREAAEREAAYTAWAAAHPEEAAAKEAKEREEARKYWARRGYRGGKSREDRLDSRAYSEGYRAGADVSLDQQVQNPVAGRLK